MTLYVDATARHTATLAGQNVTELKITQKELANEKSNLISSSDTFFHPDTDDLQKRLFKI